MIQRYQNDSYKYANNDAAWKALDDSADNGNRLGCLAGDEKKASAVGIRLE